MSADVKRNSAFETLLEEAKKRNQRSISPKKSLAKHFGKLKWDIDGLEYQKAVRSEWD